MYSSYLDGAFLILVLRRSGGLGGEGDLDLSVFCFLFDDDSDNEECFLLDVSIAACSELSGCGLGKSGAPWQGNPLTKSNPLP